MEQIEKQLTETARAIADQDEALSHNFGLRYNTFISKLMASL